MASVPERMKARLRMACALATLFALAALAGGQRAFATGPAEAAKSRDALAGQLQIYFIDVEGGQSTLIVTPSHQSLLVDTGWPGFNGRDADRIVHAVKLAGINRINYLLITH